MEGSSGSSSVSCDNWPIVEERILRASLSLDSMLDPAAQEQYASQQRGGSGDVRTGRKSKKTKKTSAKNLAKVKKGKKGDAEASKPKKANGRTKEEKEREREKKKEKKDAKKKLAGVAAESNTSSSRKSSTRSSNRSSIAAELSAAARGGAWSDADDEILEFVREETPSDHRNWSPATTPRANSTTSSSTTTASTTTTMALSLESNELSQPKKRKGKKGKKRRSTAASNLVGSRSRRSTSHDNDPGSEPIVASVENCTMKFGTASTNELLRAYHYASDEEPESKDRAEEDEEENEEEDEEEELQERDDDESGSCSSRYGWQYKNDKGESWEQFFENLQSHIAAGLPRREFAMLDEDAVQVYARRAEDFSCAVAALNFQKNRYGNVLPYNQTRVKLSRAGSRSDYVNASYVRLDDVLPGCEKITYIAASAPIPSTVEDFYRMIWETETFGIAMLTRNEEGGRPKCHQYWPEEGQTQRYGAFTVTTTKETENKRHAFAIRRILIEKDDNERREVTQYHYLAWPDHGVPDTSEPLEEIIKLINAEIETLPKPGKEPTLVIHCSAGIGRTGAFILVHSILNLIFQELKEEDDESVARWLQRAPPTVDFVHLVQHMRNQRTCMISQPEQYEFCYKMVLSNLRRALQAAGKSVPTSSSSSSSGLLKSEGPGRRRGTLAQRQKSCVLF